MSRRRKEDAHERCTASIRVHMTPTEKAMLRERAKSYGRAASDFCRLVLTDDVKAPPPSPRDSHAIRQLTEQIARAGNNINQLAKMANEKRALPLASELQTATEAIKAALKKVVQL